MCSLIWFKSVASLSELFLSIYPRKKAKGKKGLVNEGTTSHDLFFQSSEEKCQSLTAVEKWAGPHPAETSPEVPCQGAQFETLTCLSIYSDKSHPLHVHQRVLARAFHKPNHTITFLLPCRLDRFIQCGLP